MAMHSELWFPSVVWSSLIHNIDKKSLKYFVYDRRKNDVGHTVTAYNGYQSSSILPNNNEQIDLLVDTVNTEIKNCCQQTGLDSLELNDIWINIIPAGSYLSMHTHKNSVLTGVYFVDSAEHAGRLQFERADNGDYHLTDNVADATYYSTTHAHYASKSGALYIFSGWMRYGIEGNRSNKDQISIGFTYGEKV